MRAPRLPSIFKLTEYNRHRRFQYEPRLYDERKERLEKRKREIEAEEEREKLTGEAYKTYLKGKIHDSWHRKEMRRQQRASSTRLLLILAALLIILYYIFRKLDFLL